MDDFLSEKEQIEAFRQWWRENGWYLAGGVALGVLGLLGWNRYNAYVDTRSESAAAVYVELRQAVDDDDTGSALSLLNELRGDYPGSPYTDQGSLLVALMRLDLGQMRAAIDDLRFVVENTSDAELALIARLRMARVLAQEEDYGEALAALEVPAGSFAARYDEVRGDVHTALGDAESARAAYRAALDAEDPGSVDRYLVQLKLDDLPPPAQISQPETMTPAQLSQPDTAAPAQINQPETAAATGETGAGGEEAQP